MRNVGKGGSGRDRRRKGRRVMLTIRVRRARLPSQPPPTRTEIQDALRYLLRHGRMPPRWEFKAIDWQHPEELAVDWTSSVDAADVEQFREAIEAAFEHLQIAEIDRD